MLVNILQGKCFSLEKLSQGRCICDKRHKTGLETHHFELFGGNFNLLTTECQVIPNWFVAVQLPVHHSRVESTVNFCLLSQDGLLFLDFGLSPLTRHEFLDMLFVSDQFLLLLQVLDFFVNFIRLIDDLKAGCFLAIQDRSGTNQANLTFNHVQIV